ncbi:MAG: hypothetical protein AB8G77_23640 [Rhodothermales bacterium]
MVLRIQLRILGGVSPVRTSNPIGVSSLSSSSSVRRIGLELLSIFVAVFLAFGINEWREANKDAALAQTALDSLIDEMQRNRGMVAFMLPAHERVMAQTSEQTRLADIPVDSLNFLPIILRSTAWRTASETGALIHMDYETAAAVSEIYTFQEAYSKLTESMMASSFNINNYDEDKAAAQLGVMRWIAYVFVQNEQLLLEAYDNTLEKLVQE